MPPAFNDDVDRIPLIPTTEAEDPRDNHDEWVDIKRHYSLGDKRAMGRGILDYARARFNTAGQISIQDAEVNIGDALDLASWAALEVSCKEWSYTRHGEPVPLTPANLRMLEDADYRLIVAAINLRNPGERDSDTKAVSSSNVLPLSRDNAAGQMNSETGSELNASAVG